MTGTEAAEARTASGVKEEEGGTSAPQAQDPSLTYPSVPLPSFVPCSEKIHLAVTEMASLFPKVQGPRRELEGTGGASGWAGIESPTAPAWLDPWTLGAPLWLVVGLTSKAQLLHRGPPWSPCEARCGCSTPAPTGCRASAERQCPQSPAPLWTSSC